MESILQMKFFIGKLLQLFWTYQAVRIPKVTSQYGEKLYMNMTNTWERFLKIRESGLKLNKTQCQIRKQSIVFLGHFISSEDIKIDPSKIEAITKTPLPRSVNELQRFLGVINYLGKFIPNLTEHTAPLRNLLKKDVFFKLQKPQLHVIENLKTLVTSAPCLKIFDSKLPTRLNTDASSVGLGAFLQKKLWHRK